MGNYKPTMRHYTTMDSDKYYELLWQNSGFADAPKKPPTDTVLIMCGPLQVGPRSGLLLYLDCLLLYIDSTTFHSPFLPTISVLDYHSLPLSTLILLSSDINMFPSPPISLAPTLCCVFLGRSALRTSAVVQWECGYRRSVQCRRHAWEFVVVHAAAMKVRTRNLDNHPPSINIGFIFTLYLSYALVLSWCPSRLAFAFSFLCPFFLPSFRFGCSR